MTRTVQGEGGDELQFVRLLLKGVAVRSDDVGETLRNYRTSFGLSQEDIADRLGIGPTVISDYERGRRENPGAPFLSDYIDAIVAESVLSDLHETTDPGDGPRGRETSPDRSRTYFA